MNDLHATLEQLQQYVIGELSDQPTLLHIECCETCRQQAKVFQLIIKGVKLGARPVFEFDLATAVLAQLATEPPITEKRYRSDYLLAFLAIGIFAVPVFVYGRTIAGLVTNTQPAVLVTVIMAAVLVIVFWLIEFQRQSVKQALLINNAGNLQP